jgi:hypothetical protein
MDSVLRSRASKNITHLDVWSLESQLSSIRMNEADSLLGGVAWEALPVGMVTCILGAGAAVLLFSTCLRPAPGRNPPAEWPGWFLEPIGLPPMLDMIDIQILKYKTQRIQPQS